MVKVMKRKWRSAVSRVCRGMKLEKEGKEGRTEGTRSA